MSPRKKAIAGDLAATQAALEDALSREKSLNKELRGAYSTIDELVIQRDEADAACARAKEELLIVHPPYEAPDPIDAAIEAVEDAHLKAELITYRRQRDYARTGKTSL